MRVRGSCPSQLISKVMQVCSCSALPREDVVYELAWHLAFQRTIVFLSPVLFGVFKNDKLSFKTWQYIKRGHNTLGRPSERRRYRQQGKRKRKVATVRYIQGDIMRRGVRTGT